MNFIFEKNAVRVQDCEIDLARTFDCGQCFRWDFDGRGFVGVVKGRAVRAVQTEDGFILENTDEKDFRLLWENYFDLRTDYASIRRGFDGDAVLKRAGEFSKGIRILRQDPEETVFSFIISSNNNITRIKKIIKSFSTAYGEPIPFEGQTLFAFPTGSRLAEITEDGLAPLRAGYRVPYLLDAARILSEEPEFLNTVSLLPLDEARKALCRVKGIGGKVADCILLFGFSRMDAFPKDVWIKRILAEQYGEGFDPSSFGEYAGVAQQYLFDFFRNGQG